MSQESILIEVLQERRRQHARWGEQSWPDGTGTPADQEVASSARARTSARLEQGTVTFRDILEEEVAEAFAEDDPALLRAELVQVAAVAVQWIEKLDREARRR